MGKLKKGDRNEAGSVLLDIIIALLIASTAVLSTLSGIALAARTAGKAKDQSEQLIQDRNEKAATRQTLFTHESLAE